MSVKIIYVFLQYYRQSRHLNLHYKIEIKYRCIFQVKIVTIAVLLFLGIRFFFQIIFLLQS